MFVIIEKYFKKYLNEAATIFPKKHAEYVDDHIV